MFFSKFLSRDKERVLFVSFTFVHFCLSGEIINQQHEEECKEEGTSVTEGPTQRLRKTIKMAEKEKKEKKKAEMRRK